MCLDHCGIKLVELLCISLVHYWLKCNESLGQGPCGIYTELTSVVYFPQDWDSSVVKAVRLKRREKRVCSVLPPQIASIVSLS